jgi:hypothetical protein
MTKAHERSAEKVLLSAAVREGSGEEGETSL